MRLTVGLGLANHLFHQMKRKDPKEVFWPDVYLPLCPDYLPKCPKLMSLSMVGRKLGINGEEREYKLHGELAEDLRLVYSNGMAYNDPKDVTAELDRDTSIRYYIMAKSQGDDLEETVGCQHGIHLMEEWNRMKLMTILERREEKRRLEFEETARPEKQITKLRCFSQQKRMWMWSNALGCVI